jgi:hypothetical protein
MVVSGYGVLGQRSREAFGITFQPVETDPVVGAARTTSYAGIFILHFETIRKKIFCCDGRQYVGGGTGNTIEEGGSLGKGIVNKVVFRLKTSTGGG